MATATNRFRGYCLRALLPVVVAASIAVVLQQCASQPAAAPPASTAAWVGDVKPTLTIRELMTHFIDPTADFVFDAVVFDVSDKGTTQTAPVSEEEWAMWSAAHGSWPRAPTC